MLIKQHQTIFKNILGGMMKIIFIILSPTQTGNYSISFISFRTAFLMMMKTIYLQYFLILEDTEQIYANRLAAQNPNFNGGTDTNTGSQLNIKL